MTKPSLATRRKELIERCAEQRTGLAYELRALRPGKGLIEHPLTGYVLANKKRMLGAVGAGLGIALLGRKRWAGLTGTAGMLLRTWKLVRGVPEMLGRTHDGP